MEQMEQVVLEKGNTAKPPPKYRNWCGTTFNYSEKEMEQIKVCFKKYVIGREICPKTGKKHLQWHGELKNPRTVKSMRKQFSPHHIEAVKNRKESIAYCMKEWEYETNIEPEFPLEVIGVHNLYDWQKEIVRLIKKKERRKINWFWKEKGCQGKSMFCRDLLILGRTLAVDGKETDIFYALKNKKNLDCLIIDIPRIKSNQVSYAALEKILDGFCFSSKYESCCFVFDPPVVIIFSNSPPEENYKEYMSEDRWNIYEIGKKIIPRT